MKRIQILVIAVIVMICAFVLPCMTVYGSEDSSSEIDIGIQPRSYLFDIDNMKPGDWASRSIDIQNNGLQDFNYTTTVKNTKGSVKLFNQLMLEVHDTKGELYHGKLVDFNSLSSRFLAASDEETLDFTIHFPETLGNDYQGLQTAFIINFVAEGKYNQSDAVTSQGFIGGNGPPADGSTLPNTATNMFIYLLAGGGLLFVGGSLLICQKVRHIHKDQV
ncbi:TasA family protein [Lentibacillus sp. N15]|uniref:TasA family protein n=1 Tax=Lentibacillus songyuanensis TaxID=3136161 RepID=UPI0031B9F025